MAKPVISTDHPSLKHKQKNKKVPIPCAKPPSAIIDVVILFAVLLACGFLLYPYATILSRKTIELTVEISDVVSEEIHRAPYVFLCLGLSILFAIMALVAITLFLDRRCGKTGCRGLQKAAKFDIQLETEDTVRKSNFQAKSVLKKGLFELTGDHHRELEAELKKMAPVNGRAVLVFHARCGCLVGTMEIPGPRKSSKVKK
ncbi:ribosomal protein L34e superfamily protein [Striga asiatica]|uniref:Ribosomal protein L34e superfamily protein n=1 Tax=Striga asiatica TaxID=4170 RepID=A0A5A7PX06_STRAF|nr:ribosomal protein L34e superfamily protein [Striga asiatica]